MNRIITLTFIAWSLLTTTPISAQEENHHNSSFFSNVRYGGGIGAAFGNGYTNIALAPSAIKPLSEQFSVGAGLQFNYMASKDVYNTTSYGVNLLALSNPIPELQLSVELEQLRVNYTAEAYYYNQSYVPKFEKDFWNTGLFLGAGYTSGPATVGIRYNVLFKENDYVYNQAWMPFVRVYF